MDAYSQTLDQVETVVGNYIVTTARDFYVDPYTGDTLPIYETSLEKVSENGEREFVNVAENRYVFYSRIYNNAMWNHKDLCEEVKTFEDYNPDFEVIGA